jgi:hypothetical protein
LEKHSQTCILPIVFQPKLIFNILKSSMAFHPQFKKKNMIQTHCSFKPDILQVHASQMEDTLVLDMTLLNSHMNCRVIQSRLLSRL